MSKGLSKDEYIKTQSQIITAAKSIAGLKLGEFIDQINMAEMVSPFVDPTMYLKAQNNLRAIKKLTESLLPVKKAYDDLFRAVLETAVRGDMNDKVDKDT